MSLGLSGSRALAPALVLSLTWEPLRKLPTASRVAKMQRKVAFCTSCSIPTFRSNSGSAISCVGSQGLSDYIVIMLTCPHCPSHPTTQVPAPCCHSPA